MKRQKIERNSSEECLKEQICDMIKRSPFSVSSLKVDDRCFGNVRLELSNSALSFRFIQDRGDIYVEKSASQTAQ